MATYLLDTNHLAPMLNKVSALRDRLLQARKQGVRFGTCWPVLCELEAGIVQTKSPVRNRKTLGDLMKEVAVWPQDWNVVRLYGEISKQLRDKGRALSSVDIVLLSFAVAQNATLLTADLDFSGYPAVHVENWRD